MIATKEPTAERGLVSTGGRLPAHIASRLTLPLVVAPMFLVSGPELVIAACRNGAIGAFPTANCRTVGELDAWLERFDREIGPHNAPVCANLIIKRADMADHLGCLLRHRVEMVITSVGSPKAIIQPLHDHGTLVFADVASLDHARKAIDAGVDGLVLLTAGGGGQTGWANPFAFVRAVRQFYQGPLILSGGVGDGQSLLAAGILGVDLAYMGTRFIATAESAAPAAYKEMLVKSSVDDVMLTDAITGLETNILRPSLTAAGLNPAALPAALREENARLLFGKEPADAPRRWKDIWSAGHSVSAVSEIAATAELITRLRDDYASARRMMLQEM